MSNFPAIQENPVLEKAVNARSLHEFLQVSRDFASWINGRIDQFNFIQGSDFIIDNIPQNGGKVGRPSIEYFISVDMAKELSMVERSDKGKEVRKYFIECEKKLQTQSVQFSIPQTYAEALRLAADQSETIKEQAAQIEQQKPAVEFVEKYVNSAGLFGFRQVCKLLQVKENDFRAFLQDKAIMYRLNGEWVPYGRHIDAGRFYVSTGTSDTNHAFNSAKFTTKGVEWVITLYNNFLFDQIRSKQGSKA